MARLMYFKGSVIHCNHLMISLSVLSFLIYGILNSKSLVGFYKRKFYILFSLNCYALLLNGVHGMALKHKVVHATVFTEMCMFLLMLFFLLLVIFWTYQYYLKFIYSSMTYSFFHPVSSFLPSLIKCKSQLSSINYDYDTLDPVGFEGEGYVQNGFDQNEDSDNHEQFLFRFMNYQVLGNCLFTQLFHLYTLTCTFLVRVIAIVNNIIAPNQLLLLNIWLLLFLVVMGFFDYKYRRFTKSLILPHTTLLVFLCFWIYEYYIKFDSDRPEPASTINLTLTFMYIVIKFAFVTDSSFYENMVFKNKIH